MMGQKEKPAMKIKLYPHFDSAPNHAPFEIEEGKISEGALAVLKGGDAVGHKFNYNGWDFEVVKDDLGSEVRVLHCRKYGESGGTAMVLYLRD